MSSAASPQATATAVGAETKDPESGETMEEENPELPEKKEDNRQHRQVFGWYKDEPVVSDSFSLEQVGSHYVAQPSLNIGSHLMEQAVIENVKYLCVCMPCYNEGKEEIYKTLMSLMTNIEFMKKARMNETDAGKAVEREFQCTKLVMVPIFDGVKAMDESTREWLSVNFKGGFDTLLYPQPDKSPRKKWGRSMRKKSFWAKNIHKYM